MQEQRFHGITSRWIIRLGIDSNFRSIFGVGRGIDVDVTDTISMAQDGNASILLDVGDQRVASTGNDEVNDIIKSKQILDLPTTCDESDDITADSVVGSRFNSVSNDSVKHSVGVDGFLSSLEDQTVSRRQGQGGNLREGIGSGFEDNQKDSNRNGGQRNFKSIGKFSLLLNNTEAIGHVGQLSNSHFECGNLFVGQFQTFQKLTIQFISLRLIQVDLIGLENFILALDNGIRHSIQNILSDFKGHGL
mmetsp:Transcript_74872/g.217321  ORF Transcript_74872/g.217321 Transcript_74872/m.217321 type:complete len:248 (-) Transcript_74872:1018-1761(-)